MPGGITLKVQYMDTNSALDCLDFDMPPNVMAAPGPDSLIMQFARACKRIIIDENQLEHKSHLIWPDWHTFSTTWDKGWPLLRPHVREHAAPDDLTHFSLCDSVAICSGTYTCHAVSCAPWA